MTQPTTAIDMTQAAKLHRAALNSAYPDAERLRRALMALDTYWVYIKHLEERLEIALRLVTAVNGTHAPDTQRDHLDAIRETAETLGEAAGQQAAESLLALNGYLSGFAKALKASQAATGGEKVSQRAEWRPLEMTRTHTEPKNMLAVDTRQRRDEP